MTLNSLMKSKSIWTFIQCHYIIEKYHTQNIKKEQINYEKLKDHVRKRKQKREIPETKSGNNNKNNNISCGMLPWFVNALIPAYKWHNRKLHSSIPAMETAAFTTSKVIRLPPSQHQFKSISTPLINIRNLPCPTEVAFHVAPVVWQ